MNCVRTICPHYSRSLSAPFPQHLRNLSALFPRYFLFFFFFFFLMETKIYNKHVHDTTDLMLIFPHCYYSVVFPHRFRGISAVFPHCSRGISALLPQSFRTVPAVSPYSCRSPSTVLLLVGNYAAERCLCQFRQVHLIEKTVAETLSDQSDVFSYGVVSYG